MKLRFGRILGVAALLVPVTLPVQVVDKTIELCTPGDTICDGSPPGAPNIAHGLYAVNGMADEGAAFAIDRL